ncbi:hypothetical protein EVAR_47208_1 [Eumeta japonica]|uniref:Uncharacterized protein n=1 Tax=Eumeta variegata TaxID=151549 RepID=A0A4C1XTG3_EUMVA|nr:hypothetical protein EVAR_47208_1 [Eumeta japonica]
MEEQNSWVVSFIRRCCILVSREGVAVDMQMAELWIWHMPAESRPISRISGRVFTKPATARTDRQTARPIASNIEMVIYDGDKSAERRPGKCGIIS